jgi:predicted RNA polymerase sigma factor
MTSSRPEGREVGTLTIGELARLFEVPDGTMAGRILRARQRLREATERLIVDPALRDSVERD